MRNNLETYIQTVTTRASLGETINICTECTKYHISAFFFHWLNRDRRDRDCMVVGLTTTCATSSNPADDEVYSIQYYVIKFVGDLRYVGGCFWVLLWVSFTNKTYIHDITEILLKMALYIITLTLAHWDNISSGGLLVPKGITRLVVMASALTC